MADITLQKINKVTGETWEQADIEKIDSNATVIQNQVNANTTNIASHATTIANHTTSINDLATGMTSKLGTADVVDNVTSTDTAKPLSANQGKVLKTAVDLKVNTADIIDNVTTTSTTKPLSANQGKVLRDLITGIQTLLSSDDTTLDTLQEVVTYIKSEKGLIDSLTSGKVNVADIINDLTSGGTAKVLSAEQGKALKALLDALTLVVNTNSTEILESTGYGIISGLSVSAQATPNMTVNISNGTIHLSNGARLTSPGNNALTINVSDTLRPRKDIVYVSTNDGSIGYLAGNYPSVTAGSSTYNITTNAVGAVQGKQTYTLTTNFVSGDTIVFGGVTFTASASTQNATSFVVGGTTATSMTNFATALSTNTTISALYTATVSSNVITITEITAGGGNTPGAMTITGTGVISTGTATTSVVDSVTINGVTFTATTATQDSTHFIIGTDTTSTATNLKTALNANSTINTKFTATSSANIITLTEITAGGGNTPTQATKTGTIAITNSFPVISAISTPALPSTPSNSLLLAEIDVSAGLTSISSSNIIDLRSMKLNNIALYTQLYNLEKPLAVYKNGNTVRVAWKYDTNYDMWIDFQPCGQSSLIQIGDIYKAYNSEKYVNSNLTRTATPFHSKVSDWVGPYQVGAVNNKDGSNPASFNFTGGWHGYNGDQTGSAVARTIYSSIKIDNGQDVVDGTTVLCNTATLVIKNRIQGYNTAKSDGTGREIIEETVTYTIGAGSVYVQVTTTALEYVNFIKYYGLQTCNNSYTDSIRYYNSSSISPYGNPFTTASDSGTASQGSCYSYKITNGYDNIYAWIDNSYGLGTRTQVSSTTPLAWTASYGKSYFNLINGNAKSMTAGSSMYWRGSYTFYCR